MYFLVEHILSNTQHMLNAEENADLVRMFLDNGNITSVLGYNFWLALFAYFGNFLVTLIWNYTDIFLTAISLSLANMFKQFNKELKNTASTISDVSLLRFYV